MARDVIALDSSTNVNEAAKKMEGSKIGAIIVTENDKPVGIITDRDFAIRYAAYAYPIDTPVKKIMSTPLFCIRSDQSVPQVADYMYAKNVRKIPVIDEDGKVIGIVTATDLIALFANSKEEDMRKMYFHSIARIYEKYKPYG